MGRFPQYAVGDGGFARDYCPQACHQPLDHRQLRGRRHRRVTALEGNGQNCPQLLRIACMDPEPTLRRIHDRLAALVSPPRTANPPAPRVLRSVRSVRTAPPVAQVQPARAHPVSRRRRARTLFALSAPIGLLVGVAILAQAMPGPVYRVVGWLPGALESPLRAGLDYIVLLTAPRRDGLRWIEVGDPQLRKADKLSTSPR